MHRRSLIVAGLAAVAGPALAQDQSADQGPGDQGAAPQGDQGPPPAGDQYGRDQGPAVEGQMDGRYRDYGPGRAPARPYTRDEIYHNVSDFFGVTAENTGALIERLFHENGSPTAYIAGQEGSGAFFFGLRYGRGLMYMKDRPHMPIYWQGPTGGFDFGGNASRVFTLCYDLEYPDAVFRRFPGVEGSAYFVGGLGVNYQRADGITLAPVRAGVGLRLGASLGYLAYSRQRNVIPL
jgi:hypothetical protein